MKHNKRHKRHIDRMVLAIRHCDGLKEIAIGAVRKGLGLVQKLISLGENKSVVALKILISSIKDVIAAKTGDAIKPALSRLKGSIKFLKNLVGVGAGMSSEVAKKAVYGVLTLAETFFKLAVKKVSMA